MRQAMRMKFLADGVVMSGKIAVADFVCPTEEARLAFDPDYTVWMDTIKEGRFDDTNKMFEKPPQSDYHVEAWFENTSTQLSKVVERYIAIQTGNSWTGNLDV